MLDTPFTCQYVNMDLFGRVGSGFSKIFRAIRENGLAEALHKARHVLHQQRTFETVSSGSTEVNWE